MIAKKAGKISATGFVVLMLAVTYFPILVIAVFSFTKSRGFGDWNSFRFTLDAFADLFDNTALLTAVGNSLLIGLVSSFLATIIGTFSAIGLFYCRKKIRSALEYSGQITMFNADIVTAVAMMVFFGFLSMRNPYMKLIVSHTVICLPYVVMSIMPRLYQLNPNVYEAGLDLGASPIRTLFTVILPQLLGGMLAGFALAFTISMDDFTITKFVSDNVPTIPTYLYDGLKRSGIGPDVRAFSTIMLVAIMLILLAVNIFSARKAKKSKALALSTTK